MPDNNRERAVEVLFANLDEVSAHTDTVKQLGRLTILPNPEEFGLTYAFARDFGQAVPAPFERRVNGCLPSGNRIAITAVEKFDSEGRNVGAYYVFTATRRR